MRHRRTTWLAIGTATITAVAAAVFAFHAGDSGRRPAPLAVVPTRALASEPPPAVNATPDPNPDPAQGPVSDPPVVVTVRVQHSLGSIPPDAQHARRVGFWFLVRHDGERRETGGCGPIFFDGLVGLTAADVEEWGRSTLEISVFGFDDKRLERPRDPLPHDITVSVESSVPPATFAGRVRDDRGRPLAAAGVFLIGSAWGSLFEPAVRTAADGTFVLTTVVGSANDTSQSKPPTLEVVAKGFEPATLAVRRDGEAGLDVALARASVDGSLDVLLVAPDGQPAAGAHALVVPAGPTSVDKWGWPQFATDLLEGPRPESWRRLGRLVGRASFDSQGQAATAVGMFSSIIDLTADGDGHLRIDALPVGRYRLRAVLGDRGSASGREEGKGIDATNVAASVESEIDVVAPPAVSSATVRFPPGRTVVGRLVVAVNPSWHCGRDRHRHVLWTSGWPLIRVVEVDSGPERTGRFRLEGMPYGACSLHIRTDEYGREMCVVHTVEDDHGELDVDVQAAPTPVVKSDLAASEGGVTTDLGDIVVPDVRVLFGEIVGADGERLESPWPIVEMHGVEPPARAHVTFGSFRIPLRSPPSAGAVLVVGRDAGRPDVVRVPWPFEFGDAKHPLVVKLPKSEPASDR